MNIAEKNSICELKRAVVTVTMGKNYEQIASITHPSIKAYANKIGAEFVVLDKKVLSSVSPHYEKFQIYHLLNKYDRIIYVDTDAIVREDCPDLFDIVPYHMMGLVNEGKYQDRSAQMKETCDLYEGDFSAYDLKRYYNTGVMVVSRVHKDLFVKPEKETIWNFYEQSYLNLRIQEMRIRVFELEHKFNRVSIMDKVYGEHRLASYIVHYAGILGGLTNLIPADLSRWAKGEHRTMRRKIVFGVGAKLGDNVCAEPIIRYMMKNAKDTNFVIVSTHPDLFTHLDAEITTFEKPYGSEDPCLFFNTTMDERDPRREFLSADYMHIVDYISLLCLRRQLPDKDKQIKLPVSTEGLVEVMDICQNPNDLILVHPGKSWPSKTFPNRYWEEIIDTITKSGKCVGVIGNHVSENVGVLDVRIQQNVCDFRNLLSVKGLVALISLAPVLVSNDSAPVHVAGAFDNHIVVIPTCKHPDLILPYRNGSKCYKVDVLSKRLISDDVCLDPANLSNYDMSRQVPIWNYLPPSDEVAQKAIYAHDNAKR